MITLIGGPYNRRQIEDSGAVQIRMAITEDGTERKGVKCGTAIYEPSEDRAAAFWLQNIWDGTLEEVIRP
jgi:hypothetical protein